MQPSTRFGRALLQVGGAQLLAGALKLMTPVIAARMLAPEDFGTYSVCVVVVLMIFNLGSLGISSSTTYHVARSRRTADVTSYNSLVLALVLGMAGAAVGGVAAVGLGDEIVDADLATVLFALCCVPTYYVVNAGLGFFLGRHDYRGYNRLSVGFYAAVLAGTVVALSIAPTATAAVAGWCAGSLVTAAVAVVGIRPAWAGRRRLDLTYWRDALGYGAKSHVSTAVTFLSYRLDVLLVAALMTSASAGRYAAIVAVGEGLWFVSQVSSWVLFAHVAADDDPARRRRLTELTARLVTFLSMTGAIVVAVCAVPLLSAVYGGEYASGAGALRILVIGVVSLSVSRVLANYVAAIGSPARNIPGSLVALILNVVLNVALIPVIGIEGAALASTISYSVTLVDRLRAYGPPGERLRDAGRCLLPRRSDVSRVRELTSNATRRLRRTEPLAAPTSSTSAV